jgi:hypothetical protein
MWCIYVTFIMSPREVTANRCDPWHRLEGTNLFRFAYWLQMATFAPKSFPASVARGGEMLFG